MGLLGMSTEMAMAGLVLVYDFTVYRKDSRERLAFTVEAANDDAARLELEHRMAGVGITPEQMPDWRIGVTVLRARLEKIKAERDA